MAVLKNSEGNFSEFEWLTTVAFLGALCCAVLGIKLKWFKARLDFHNNSDIEAVQPRLAVYRPYGIEVYNPSYRESDGVPLYTPLENSVSSIRPIDSELSINNHIESNIQVQKPLVHNDIKKPQNVLLTENKPIQNTSALNPLITKPIGVNIKNPQNITVENKPIQNTSALNPLITKPIGANIKNPQNITVNENKPIQNTSALNPLITNPIGANIKNPQNITVNENKPIQSTSSLNPQITKPTNTVKEPDAKKKKRKDDKDKSKKPLKTDKSNKVKKVRSIKVKPEQKDSVNAQDELLTKKERVAKEKREKEERVKREKEEKARKAKEQKELAQRLKEEKAQQAKEEKERKLNDAKLKKENDKKNKENKTKNQTLPVASVTIDNTAATSQSDNSGKTSTAATKRNIPLKDPEPEVDFSDTWNMVAAHRQNLPKNLPVKTTTNLRDMANQQKAEGKKSQLFIPNSKKNNDNKSVTRLDDSDASDEYDV